MSMGLSCSVFYCHLVHRLQVILNRLMNIYQHTQTEDHVREAAASTAVRLLRVNQQLVPEFMVQHGVALVSKGLRDGSSRMQIVAMNILNLCLMQQSLQEKVVSWLSEDQVVIPMLLKLLNLQTQVSQSLKSSLWSTVEQHVMSSSVSSCRRVCSQRIRFQQCSAHGCAELKPAWGHLPRH